MAFIFKVDMKSQILPQLISLGCLYYNVWTHFYLLYVFDSEVVARPEEFFKKGVLKYSTKFTCKHLHRVPFCNKVAGWRHLEILSCKFCKIFRNIYFANLCEGLPPKNRIFTGVSFYKIFGFYYKRSRKLFYYGGILYELYYLEYSWTCKYVIFQNSSESLLLNIP